MDDRTFAVVDNTSTIAFGFHYGGSRGPDDGRGACPGWPIVVTCCREWALGCFVFRFM